METNLEAQEAPESIAAQAMWTANSALRRALRRAVRASMRSATSEENRPLMIRTAYDILATVFFNEVWKETALREGVPFSECFPHLIKIAFRDSAKLASAAVSMKIAQPGSIRSWFSHSAIDEERAVSLEWVLSPSI